MKKQTEKAQKMSNDEEFPDLLTPEEAAKILEVGVSVVYKYLIEGKMPGMRIGNLWRVKEDDLAEFVASYKSASPDTVRKRIEKIRDEGPR